MTLYTSVVTLLLVMDSLGNVPVFLSVLKPYEPSVQRRIILREVLIAFLILLAFVFFGPHLMKGLNLSASALSVSGGIILFLIAIKMIFPQPESKISSPQEEPFYSTTGSTVNSRAFCFGDGVIVCDTAP